MKMNSIKTAITAIILASSISSVFALVPSELMVGASQAGVARTDAPLATTEEDPEIAEEAAAEEAAAEEAAAGA